MAKCSPWIGGLECIVFLLGQTLNFCTHTTANEDSMDSRAVCDFFNGSPFSEDLQFDYSDKLLQLEQVSREADGQTAEEQLVVRLLEAILSTLGGDHQQAHDILHTESHSTNNSIQHVPYIQLDLRALSCVN